MSLGIQRRSQTYKFDVVGPVDFNDLLNEFQAANQSLTRTQGEHLEVSFGFHKGMDQRETDYLTIHVRIK